MYCGCLFITFSSDHFQIFPFFLTHPWREDREFTSECQQPPSYYIKIIILLASLLLLNPYNNESQTNIYIYVIPSLHLHYRDR
jgi:hypothetical protein